MSWHFELRFEEVLRIERDLKAHFSRGPVWRFGNLVGCGLAGAVVRIDATRSVWLYDDDKAFDTSRKWFQNYKKICLKRAISWKGREELSNEIRWLERTRGAEHIVNMIAGRDDRKPRPLRPQRPPGPVKAAIRRGMRRIRQYQTRLLREVPGWGILVDYFMAPVGSAIWDWVIDAMSHVAVGLALDDPLSIDEELRLDLLAGQPVLVTEYLENGTVAKLIERIANTNEYVPDRLLWSFMLCLVRACIGLAYPIHLEAGDPTELETLPTDMDLYPPGDLRHGDINTRNIGIGQAGGRYFEHIHTPVVKLLDLGNATEQGKGNAVAENLEGIAKAMILLHEKKKHHLFTGVDYNGVKCDTGKITSGYELNEELIYCFASCVTADPNLRPSLQDMLMRVQATVLETTPAEWSRSPWETDESLQRFCQRYLYDADTGRGDWDDPIQYGTTNKTASSNLFSPSGGSMFH
ncbi:hypothetical protein F5Y04DRAFT_290236 [Hypomontagnella monticulosa]|nr:hypothetical protein F5Y04DRAFT_290236 [Hypomontagnella monticulosa]